MALSFFGYLGRHYLKKVVPLFYAQKKESETNVEERAPTKKKNNYKEKKMEEILEFIVENAVSIATSVAVVLCYVFGKPKTAEKIKKAKEKQLAKVHNKSIKLVKELQKANKKEENIKKEIEEC